MPTKLLLEGRSIPAYSIFFNSCPLYDYQIFDLFGQYVHSDADDAVGDDTGYLFGVKFGHKKLTKFAEWLTTYNYRRIERDAWPDFLPDSDFYGGATNVKGHELEFEFSLHKNVSLGLDYYHSQPIRLPAGATNRDQDLIQVDLLLKW
jgi:hypothetical protein